MQPAQAPTKERRTYILSSSVRATADQRHSYLKVLALDGYNQRCLGFILHKTACEALAHYLNSLRQSKEPRPHPCKYQRVSAAQIQHHYMISSHAQATMHHQVLLSTYTYMHRIDVSAVIQQCNRNIHIPMVNSPVQRSVAIFLHAS